MKHFSSLIALLFILLGCNNHVDDVKLKTIPISVNANEWQYTQTGPSDQFNNNYFYAVVDMPEITRTVFDHGEVKAYIVYNRSSLSKARKHLLPYVLHLEHVGDDGKWSYFTETYDFTYGIGWAEFNFRTSDFAYEDNININPPAMDFDIVITYPQE